MAIERNREETEKRILDAVGRLIATDGFEKVGVNAVAMSAGVAKMLIYRYFDSFEGLLAAYIRKYDYWLNVDISIPTDRGLLAPFVVRLYQSQIEQLRTDVVMRRLLRWELSVENDMITKVREYREEQGLKLISAVSKLSRKPQSEVAVMASLISASITYLILLADRGGVYNGISIDSEEGWEQIVSGIEIIVNKYLG
ncbi:MAG: TetR/AcrR family transcriptional regulator [Bacteroidaceae bacterium]|nr:TetR/AcrR family transcriptional regulator [Bacteroidaceae bacterium]